MERIMAVNLTAGGVGALVGVVVIGGVVYYLYTHRKAMVEAVNPMSEQNLAYKTANKLTQAITGDDKQTFGGWISDLLLPAYDPKAYTGKPLPSAGNPNYYSKSASNMTRDPGQAGSGTTAPGFSTTTPGWESLPMGLSDWTLA